MHHWAHCQVWKKKKGPDTNTVLLSSALWGVEGGLLSAYWNKGTCIGEVCLQNWEEESEREEESQCLNKK